jgi:hypothetical protein
VITHLKHRNTPIGGCFGCFGEGHFGCFGLFQPRFIGVSARFGLFRFACFTLVSDPPSETEVACGY